LMVTHTRRKPVVNDGALARRALGTLAFFIVAPGTVAGVAPWIISGGWRHGDVPSLVSAVGAFLAVVGLTSLVESFARFVIRGHGTPAPVAPPAELVVTGQYRHVRNPMYVALVLSVWGQAAWLGSGPLFLYGAVLWLLFHLRVVLYEEATLAKQFGTSFEEYRAGVPRWVPRPAPWRADQASSGEAQRAGLPPEE
jgi:protein-S-isoprenylcysteine O-methyltransferase Ste14